MLFKSALTAVALAAGVFAAPAADVNSSPMRRAPDQTPTASGFHEGYYYNWWTDGSNGEAKYVNGPRGSYSVSWNNTGNFVGGKGWEIGTARDITYSADWTAYNNSNSYLGVYGLADQNGSRFRVEYYILESFGGYSPAYDTQNTRPRGSVVVDGAKYDLYEGVRVYMWPSYTLRTYWAVREKQRTRGTIKTAKIFDAWAAANMTITEHSWQIVMTEGYYSSGDSQVTISSPP
jgi:endo-1,4-beta-xylanase